MKHYISIVNPLFLLRYLVRDSPVSAGGEL
jgi:hypothetical protein